MFEPSSGEAIVGRGVAGRYRGAELGDELEFGRGRWKVVGVFESGGTSFESEVWVRRARARRTTRSARSPTRACACASPTAPTCDALARRIDDDPRYALEAQPETEYYAKQAESANALYVLVVGARGAGRHRRGLRRHQHAVRRGAGAHAPRSARCARSASRAASILVSFLIESLRDRARRLRGRRRARRRCSGGASRGCSAASASAPRPSHQRDPAARRPRATSSRRSSSRS